jgi:hypothetical protein
MTIKSITRDLRHAFAISPPAREFWPLRSARRRLEGAGNAGRSMRPQPRVQNKKAHEHSHHGHAGYTRHSLRNGFTVSFVIFPVIGLLSPSPRVTARLDAGIEASEPHDFAVRVGAVRQQHHQRPPHPAPRP